MSEKPKEYAEQIMFPIFVLATLLSGIFDLYEALINISKLFSQNRMLFGTVFYGCLAMLAFFLPGMQKPLISAKYTRAVSLSIIAIFYYADVLHPIRCLVFDCGPASRPEISRLMSSAHAAPVDSLKIVRVSVDRSRTSFLDTQANLFLSVGKFRTFQFNMATNNAFRKGRCTGITGEKPIRDVLPIFTSYLRKYNKSDFLMYFSSEERYRRLIINGGNTLEKLMFDQNYLQELKHSDKGKYKKVLKWMVLCIGVTEPIIKVTVRNDREVEVALLSLTFDVKEVGQVLGGVTRPLVPTVEYDFVLNHSVGEQRLFLEPPLVIPPQSIAEFAVRITPAKKEPGLAWLLDLKVENDRGDIARSEKFQLLLSK